MMNKLPEGVEIRGKSLRIMFMYRGTRCRETLKGWTITPANIKKAGRLRASITHDITTGAFTYTERFPNSKSAHKFSSTFLGSITVSELFVRWIETKKLDYTPETAYRRKIALKKCAKLLGADRRISAITHEDAIMLRNALAETLKVKTVNTYFSSVRLAFILAAKSGAIDNSPFSDIGWLKEIKNPPDPLEINDLHQLISCDSIRRQERNLWTIACFTGLRHGELCVLSWSDVDFEHKTLHVQRALTSFGRYKTPKTAAGDRIINLLNPALEALKDQFELTSSIPANKIEVESPERNRKISELCQWVFVTGLTKYSPKGKMPDHYSTLGLSKLWQSCTVRSKIRKRKPYQTRHTYACWMLSKGANAAYIASQMGHVDMMMLMKVYGAWMPSGNQSESDKLNAIFSELPHPCPTTSTNNKLTV